MSLIQNRAAVAPLHRHITLGTEPAFTVPSVDEIVAKLRPEEPLHCVRPTNIAAASSTFVQAFNGDVLYAVKCNPEPAVLRAVWEGGVRHFDCASIAEVSLVRRLFPGAEIHFMHPVKSRAAIREAWLQNGVRDFVARPLARKLGVAFHVGSQCMDPLAWREAIALTGRVIRASGVRVDVIDVGGGFPVAYPDIDPPPLGAFMAEIDAAFDALDMPGVKLWAEPGRALAAGGGSVVVQVQLRKGNMLYVNDGVFGSLADAGALGFRFPARLIRASAENTGAPAAAFGLFGPTCDSSDVMRGPFMLPDDVAEGDWIEIGQLGAYGSCLRTSFNGFDRAALIEVRDRAMLETAGYDPAELPPAFATAA